MLSRTFEAITADMEKHLNGAGYSIDVRTNSGLPLSNAAWQWLDSEKEVIVLTNGDFPPMYVPVSSIELVQLTGR